MQTTTQHNATQLDAYIALTAQAGVLLAELTAWIDDHGEIAPDDVTDAHVTRMNHVVKKIRAAQFIAERM